MIFFCFFKEYQEPLQTPQRKIPSHLTITVRSTVMSVPSPSSRGSKPLVAPKPRHAKAQVDDQSQSINNNGDVESSDTLEQESESELTQDESDPPEEFCLDKSKDEELLETPSNQDFMCGKGIDEVEIVVKVGPGKRQIQDDDHASSVNDIKDVIDIFPSAVDHFKGTTGSTIQSQSTNFDCTVEYFTQYPDNEFSTEDQKEGQSEANDDAPAFYEEIQDSTLNQSTYAEIENPDVLTSDSVLTSHDLVEPQSNEEECSPTGSSSHLCDTHPSEPDLTGHNLQGSQASLSEEYPYDVIGPLDDTSAWQPERATKDQSGRFRFSEEEGFEPYSVIEAVPADLMSTSDPEVDYTEEPSSLEKAKQTTTMSIFLSEPFYDVAEMDAENSSLLSEPQDQDDQKETTNVDTVDDYADIDNSSILCDDEDDRLECVSSEDYVEIGDEDEPDDMKEKPNMNRSSRYEQGDMNQRNSCQPRLRLCNITVPPDLDLGRTPEITNRLVFAHTTEAFEEDIQDLDCHIVPFLENSDSDSDEHIYEEAGFDSDGENFIVLDRKTVVTRSRSLSGKVPGYVPETVPEETGNESQTHDYYTVSFEQNGDLIKSPDIAEVNRIIPSHNSRRVLICPRSYSVEGRDMHLSAHLEGDRSPRLENRKEDTLSLPCVITSSGSFSQRSHQSSSGVSTPTSLVEIPPPFELAYITKRPITKSSPSLLIQHELNDKPKKKKTSFKRFLALKFKRKNDSKSVGDGSVRSSRSSSESSHHGPSRVIDIDRRSTSSSPQLQSRVVKSHRNPDFSTTFVVYNDRQKKKGVPKTYGNRSISRVESFEERSRPPFMPLPLTKPRSISFPSADTSDYENIPAMTSDYENIQIPTGRPTRAVTITEFFDDQIRTGAVNENDGYVDMNSLAGIENKPNTQEQEAER